MGRAHQATLLLALVVNGLLACSVALVPDEGTQRRSTKTLGGAYTTPYYTPVPTVPDVTAVPPVAPGGCLCTMQLSAAPVCGTDGKTYSSACEARCTGGVGVKCMGSCDYCASLPPVVQPSPQPGTAADDCVCIALFQPVCGVDGKTYGNACEAGCAKVAVKCNDSCENCLETPSPSPLPSPSPSLKPSPKPESCICYERYAPVCGVNGKTYGNACRAKCAKVAVKSTGACIATLDCRLVRCSTLQDGSGVCGADGKTYPNLCIAQCVENVKVVSLEGCKPKPSPKSPAPCICTREFLPVCGVNGKTYGNACLAKCAKVPLKCRDACANCPKRSPKPSPTPSPSPQAGTCGCTREFQPVCGVNGKTYSNACMAKCAKVAVQCPDACTRCPKRSPKPSPTPSPSPQAGNCICTLEYRPVCGVDGKTYGNACAARCAKVAVKCSDECANCPKPSPTPSPVKPSPTPSPVKPSPSPSPAAGNCICTLEFRPVCGVDGKTYGNACAARCAGVAVKCSDECANCPKASPTPSPIKASPTPSPVKASPTPSPIKASPSPSPAAGDAFGCAAVTCPAIFKPVCGVNNETFANDCLANCTGVQVAYQGECSALPPVSAEGGSITCKANDPGVKCFANPCGLPSKCKDKADLVCYTFYCSKAVLFRGVQISTPCSAVYVSKTTRKVVKCGGY